MNFDRKVMFKESDVHELRKKKQHRKFPFNKDKTELESSILLVMIVILAVLAWEIFDRFY
ncbi:MAG TPA: hypothetical protein VJY62_12105 [Bacteroidia bacterium]|nr:hypothetical protein [Bacteroidia bacterium]